MLESHIRQQHRFVPVDLHDHLLASSVDAANLGSIFSSQIFRNKQTSLGADEQFISANKTKIFADSAEIRVAKHHRGKKKNNGATKRLAFELRRHEGLQLGGSSSGRDGVSGPFRCGMVVSANLFPPEKSHLKMVVIGIRESGPLSFPLRTSQG